MDDWQPMEDAPIEVLVLGLYEDGSIDLVQWQGSRQCMLASVAPGAGQCGPGWVSADCGYLPVDPPIRWKPYTTQHPEGGDGR